MTKASFENSMELLDEAYLLSKNEKYARACALGVLSAEEFTKTHLLILSIFNRIVKFYEYDETKKQLIVRIPREDAEEIIGDLDMEGINR